MCPQGPGAEPQVLRAIIRNRDGIDLSVLGVQCRLAPHKLWIPKTRWEDVLIHVTGLAISLYVQSRHTAGSTDLVAHAIVVRGRIERYQLTVHPALGRTVLQPISRDKQNLHGELGRDTDVCLWTLAADLDRVGADLLAVSHDGEPHRFSRLRSHSRGWHQPAECCSGDHAERSNGDFHADHPRPPAATNTNSGIGRKFGRLMAFTRDRMAIGALKTRNASEPRIAPRGSIRG